MSNFIYSAMSGKNDPMFGKFEHPIKALIENESNICEKRKTILDTLFNVEKSNRYAETIMGESDFSTFMSKQEGQGAENDNVEPTFKKTIEHIEFAKEFTITRKMADDAKFGIGADMKNKPRKFVRAYYNTRVKIAAQALINGTSKTMTFNKAKVDLTCADELALFHKAHPYFTDKMKGKTQSNYFYGEITGSIGMLASASLNDKKQGLFEPSHGSAPDIAGKNIANPIATVLSAAMMLRYSFDMNDEADAIEKAVEKVLADGVRTGDIMSEGCRKVSCSEMGDAIAAAIR